MGKHCHDEGCPGVYEDDGTCSHCGKTDQDTFPYLHLTVSAESIQENVHQAVRDLRVQVKLDDEGVVVDVYESGRPPFSIASAHKTYQDMAVSVRRWYEGDDLSATELCKQWKSGKRNQVIDSLVVAHPCVTALMIHTGIHEFNFKDDDITIITNLLIDRKTEENERLS